MKHESTKNMTSGPLWKQIIIFSIPLMLSNVLQVFFNMSDIAVVGRFAGSKALGSVGSTSIMILLFTGLVIGMGSGVNVLVARYVGAKDQKNVETTVHTSLVISLAYGFLVMIVGLLVSRGVLILLGTKPELMDGAVLYVKLYLLGTPALAIYNYGNGVLSAVGDTKRPLIFLSISGVVNIILNVFFVVVCNISVAGVALASIISQYLSATLILICLFRNRDIYGLKFSKIKVDWGKARMVLSLGIPAGLQNAIFALANLFIQAGVNTFDTVMVEGNSAAVNADCLVFDVMMAFYTACSSFMGQNYGAGKKKRVIKSYFVCLTYSFGIGMIFGLTILVFGREFLSFFTSDPAVVEAGYKRLELMAWGYAFSAFMDCSIAASRGLGKTVVPTVLVVLGSCVFRIIWVYTIFAYFKTIPSLYLLYIFSWIITSIAEIIYFRKCYKQRMKELDQQLEQQPVLKEA